MGVPRNNFLTSSILSLLDLDMPLIPLETPYQFLSRKHKLNKRRYRDSLRGLSQRGAIKIVRKKDSKFIKLTKKGALKVLLEKAKAYPKGVWDHKWRILVFDIPEEFNAERDRFRRLLKINGFAKLQASVFVSPYVLSREAISYLKDTGLIKYIRIMKVEEIDDDSDLKKRFSL